MSRRIYATRASRPPASTSRDDFIADMTGQADTPLCRGLVEWSDWNRPWVTVAVGTGWIPQSDQLDAMVTVLSRLDHTLDRMVRANIAGCFGQDLPDGVPLRETALDYAVDLVADRLRLPRSQVETQPRQVPQQGAPEPSEADLWVAKMVAASMLTTRSYLVLRSLGGVAAVHRPGHPETAREPKDAKDALDPRPHEGLLTRTRDGLQSLRDGLEEALQDLESVLKGRLDRCGPAMLADSILGHISEEEDEDDRSRRVANFLEPVLRVLTALAGGLHQELGKRMLFETDVRALSELTWFCLSSFDQDAYPGWLDLLLELSQYDDPEQGTVGRPSFNTVSKPTPALLARYSRLTEQSWRKDEGSELHESVAKLIIRQANYRSHYTKKEKPYVPLWKPPHAVAHVTSFDIELEMALLRRAQEFHIILPVHVKDRRNNVLHLRWLMVYVPKDSVPGNGRDVDVLRAVHTPASENLTLLTGKRGELDSIATPLVVRLAGCPLMKLPPLEDENGVTELGQAIINDTDIANWYRANLGIRDGKAVVKNVNLLHAIVLNEYDAMLQNSMDYLPGLGRQLPLETVVGGAGWQRYWMLLGVQVGDHAIRQRVSHVVSWLPLADVRKPVARPKEAQPGVEAQDSDASDGADQVEDSVEGTSTLGVLVSRHVGLLEQDLLYWNRFNIVEKEDVQAFLRDLDHIAEAHLSAESENDEMIPCE